MQWFRKHKSELGVIVLSAANDFNKRTPYKIGIVRDNNLTRSLESCIVLRATLKKKRPRFKGR